MGNKSTSEINPPRCLEIELKEKWIVINRWLYKLDAKTNFHIDSVVNTVGIDLALLSERTTEMHINFTQAEAPYSALQRPDMCDNNPNCLYIHFLPCSPHLVIKLKEQRKLTQGTTETKGTIFRGHMEIKDIKKAKDEIPLTKFQQLQNKCKIMREIFYLEPPNSARSV